MLDATGTRSVRWAVKTVAALGLGLAGVAVPVAAAEPAPTDPVAPAPPDPAVVVQAAAPASLTPADGVSHLPSPDSLPPGTTTTSQAASDHPTLDYLKDVWTALRTKEVSAGDALLLLAQRPVDSTKATDSVPQSQSGPETPAPAVPAAEVPAPAPPSPAPSG